MRLIKVTGGLGNQMFIYAMYLRMKQRFPDTRLDLSDMVHYKVHHGYELHRVFHLPKTEFCIPQKLKKVLEFLFFRTIIERKQKGSMRPYLRRYAWPFIYFKGFYQSEKYFGDIRDEVRRAFTFPVEEASPATAAMLRQIDGDGQAVSLHIRRGDYLLPKHWEAIGCICQLPYYRNALRAMEERVPSPHYYVFSDDLEWVKQHLPLQAATYIDWNRGEDSWQDMLLMSHCRHHIICNSTFSWWGAWLDLRAEKIVIAPAQWTRHEDSQTILPPEWVQVPVH